MVDYGYGASTFAVYNPIMDEIQAMDSRSIYWRTDSPFRRPAWRWLRANYLLLHRQSPEPQVDDEWVQRACRFLVAQTGLNGADSHATSRDADPAIAVASNLWRQEPAHQGRSKLEAYLLTGEPFIGIAQRCALSGAVVEAYHQLFFAWRSNPRATDWILAQVIGTRFGQCSGPVTLGTLWKYCALSGGPRVLELVIAVTLDHPLPDGWSLPGPPLSAADEALLRARTKVVLSALTAHSDAAMRQVVAAQTALRRLLRKRTGKSHDTSELLLTMELFLKRKTQAQKAISRKQSRKAARMPRHLAGLPFGAAKALQREGEEPVEKTNDEQQQE